MINKPRPKELIEIVKFSNGLYGLRKTCRGLIEYKSILANMWWEETREIEKYCLTKDYTKIKYNYELITNKPKPMTLDTNPEIVLPEPIPPISRNIGEGEQTKTKRKFKFPKFKFKLPRINI